MERIRESYHEDEALEDVSLCDLPLLNSPTKHQEEEEEKEEINKLNKNDKNEARNNVVFEPQEEFAFGSAGSKMCAADEVFFQGQILPLRPSFGSDTISPTQLNLIQNSIRLESLDRSSLTGFTIISSRSSSSSSRSTTQPEATPMAITRVTSEPRLRTRSRNQFHTHPSPKLHMRASSARSSASSTTAGARLDRASSNKIKHKSSVWDFFKLGLVRTPDIELQDIRANLRNNNRAILKGANSTTTTPISRSSSDSGNNNNNNNFNTNTASYTSSRANDTTTSESSKNVEKQKGMKFLSGCTCSSEAVASNAIVAKSKGNSNENNSINNIHGISGTKSSNWMKLEKLLLLEEDHRLIKMKNNVNNCDNYHYYKKKQSGRDNDDDDDQKQKKQYLKDQGRRKQAHVSHHRTYEWLKELSHANLAMHV